jgi:hypothetical protein
MGSVLLPLCGTSEYATQLRNYSLPDYESASRARGTLRQFTSHTGVATVDIGTTPAGLREPVARPLSSIK